MSKTHCGACRGERGCKDCQAVGGFVQYTGLTEFFVQEPAQVQSNECAEVQENCSGIFCDKELFLAADLGTTTLAFVCTDVSGEVLASYSCENPQRKTAADVIGRIDAALHGQRESLTNEIREALVKGFLFVLTEALEHLRGRGTNCDGMRVKIGIAGNTVMQHLLLGYPLEGMAKAPFTPYRTDKIMLTFSDFFPDTVGNCVVPQMLKKAEVTGFPCLSAFVGGDAVAGANAVFSKDKERIELLVDLGTNGELLLSVKGRWYGTAAAMGSAMEGGRYAYASDLFRYIAKALENGVLDETGLLCETYFTEGYEGLLQEDIREFQLAKGAIRAGIELLCGYAEVKPEQVEQIYVAGGVGRYCRTEDFILTGLLPSEFAGKVKVVGNSCIGGILSCLLNGKNMIYCEGESLNLAEQPEFEELYYRFMNFEKRNQCFGNKDIFGKDWYGEEREAK